MQNGAPVHFANDIHKWLHDHLLDRWIGRRGAHEWPARSPDLTPCDLFLWGRLRSKFTIGNNET